MSNDNYPHADAAKQQIKDAGANPKEQKSVSQPDGTAANAPRGETQAQPQHASNQQIDPASTTRGTEGGENRPQAQRGTNDGRPTNTGADQNRYEAKGELREKGAGGGMRSEGQGHGKDHEFGEAVDIGQDNHELGNNLSPKQDDTVTKRGESASPTQRGGHNPSEDRPDKEGASAERGGPDGAMDRLKEKQDEEAA